MTAHEHVYRCGGCGEIGRGPLKAVATPPPPPLTPTERAAVDVLHRSFQHVGDPWATGGDRVCRCATVAPRLLKSLAASDEVPGSLAVTLSAALQPEQILARKRGDEEGVA